MQSDLCLKPVEPLERVRSERHFCVGCLDPEAPSLFHTTVTTIESECIHEHSICNQHLALLLLFKSRYWMFVFSLECRSGRSSQKHKVCSFECIQIDQSVEERSCGAPQNKGSENKNSQQSVCFTKTSSPSVLQRLWWKQTADEGKCLPERERCELQQTEQQRPRGILIAVLYADGTFL